MTTPPHLTLVLPVLAHDPKIITIANTFMRSVPDWMCLIVVANGPLAKLLTRATIVTDESTFGYGHAVNAGLAAAPTRSKYFAVGSCDLGLPENWALPMCDPEFLVTPMDTTHPRDVKIRGSWWAALWVMPNQVYKDIGGLDEQFGLRICAQDYAIRAHQAGWGIRREPSVRVDHLAFRHSVHHQKAAVMEEQARFEDKYGAVNYKQWHAANCGCDRG